MSRRLAPRPKLWSSGDGLGTASTPSQKPMSQVSTPFRFQAFTTYSSFSPRRTNCGLGSARATILGSPRRSCAIHWRWAAGRSAVAFCTDACCTARESAESRPSLTARTTLRAGPAMTAPRSRTSWPISSITSSPEARRLSDCSSSRRRTKARSASLRFDRADTVFRTPSRLFSATTGAPRSSAATSPKSNQSVAVEYSAADPASSGATRPRGRPTKAAAPSRPEIRRDHSNPLSRKSPIPSGATNTALEFRDRCSVPPPCSIASAFATRNSPSQSGLRLPTSDRFVSQA